jgi:hypothetical protein
MNRALATVAGLLLVLVAAAAAAERPVVVELFTSEGCSSCPPADALLAELAARPEVLALSFHVDYWDRLGWKDPFSSTAATARQQRYAKLLGTGSVYTPQAVVDGSWQAIGSDREAIAKAIAAAASAGAGVPVRLTVDHDRARIAVAAVPGVAGASVVLVGFDRRHVDAVRGGENDGRTLAHVDVVREIAALGSTDGRDRTIDAPITGWHADRLAVLVAAGNGRILGAAVADTGLR